MNDMVLFSGSKERLKEWLKNVEAFLDHTLGLKLNNRAICLNTGLHGLPFLGFRLFPNLIRIKKENLKRLKLRIKEKVRAFNNGNIEDSFPV